MIDGAEAVRLMSSKKRYDIEVRGWPSELVSWAYRKLSEERLSHAGKLLHANRGVEEMRAGLADFFSRIGESEEVDSRIRILRDRIRAKRYRMNKAKAGMHFINIPLDKSTFSAIHRLSKYRLKTQADVVNEIILEADQEIKKYKEEKKKDKKLENMRQKTFSESSARVKELEAEIAELRKKNKYLDNLINPLSKLENGDYEFIFRLIVNEEGFEFSVDEKERMQPGRKRENFRKLSNSLDVFWRYLVGVSRNSSR